MNLVLYIRTIWKNITYLQYNRLLYVREMVQGLKGTEFMRALAKARDVLPPIMKTNIILHNPDFKLAYGLWLYLDRVDGILATALIWTHTHTFDEIKEFATLYNQLPNRKPLIVVPSSYNHVTEAELVEKFNGKKVLLAKDEDSKEAKLQNAILQLLTMDPKIYYEA